MLSVLHCAFVVLSVILLSPSGSQKEIPMESPQLWGRSNVRVVKLGKFVILVKKSLPMVCFSLQTSGHDEWQQRAVKNTGTCRSVDF